MTEGRIRLVLDAVSTLAIGVAAILIGWRAFTDARPSRAEPGRAPAAWVAVTGLETAAPAATAGKPGPRIALLEFSDFQCPFCSRYATQVYPEVQRDFVQNGRIAYVFRNFPLEAIHARAFRAAEAAACAADQGHFWEMHDRLFLNQRALEDADLMGRARDLKLDQAKFEDCLGGTVADRIRNDIADGEKLGVTGTPTFMIGEILPTGKIRLMKKFEGIPSYSALKTGMEEALKGRLAAAG